MSTLIAHVQAEAAASSDRQRLSGLSRELESRAAADSDALLRLQETLAAQKFKSRFFHAAFQI